MLVGSALLVVVAPNLGRDIDLNYYAAFAQAIPVFYLAMLVLRRRKTDEFRKVADDWRDTQTGNLEAAVEVREVVAIADRSPGRGNRGELDEMIVTAKELLAHVDDKSTETEMRRLSHLLASYLLGATMIAILAECAALWALADANSTTLLLAVSGLGALALVAMLVADDLHSTRWAGRGL
jgi:hypothetical protein